MRTRFVFSVRCLVSRQCHNIGSICDPSSPLRYYEGSDSCIPSPQHAGLSGPYALPSWHPDPNHVMQPERRFSSHLSALGRSTQAPGFAMNEQARHSHPAESGSSSYGLPFHLQLLSTPPHGDAVTFSYVPCDQSTTGTCTPMTKRPVGRTHPRGGGGPDVAEVVEFTGFPPSRE